MKLVIVITAVTIAALSSIPPMPAYAAGVNPIAVQQCFVVQPKPMSKKPRGTQIDFVNKGPKTAVSVTFAVGYRNAESNFLRRVVDRGTFSPGTPVQHTLSLYNDVTYAGKQTYGCRAVAVTWADGSRWTGP